LFCDAMPLRKGQCGQSGFGGIHGLAIPVTAAYLDH
jgi:hypothetical protein